MIRIKGIIGSRIGASKNAQGGWKWVKEKPKEVTIFRRNNMDGLITLYDDIKLYWDLRHRFGTSAFCWLFNLWLPLFIGFHSTKTATQLGLSIVVFLYITCLLMTFA